MAEISIAYTVPIQVLVDTTARRVTRVIVIDEEITPDATAFNQDFSDRVNLAEDDPRVRSAYAIAEETEWPAWDHGW